MVQPSGQLTERGVVEAAQLAIQPAKAKPSTFTVQTPDPKAPVYT
jgi:hypothetical protein